MQWSDRQEKAITEHGKNILVSAAAGSGKTAVLIERIYRLITGERKAEAGQGPSEKPERVSLENMLVVTFTKAAATEMKERLRNSLAKAIAECGDPDTRKLLSSQQKALGRADICTFDSFAQKIVKNYYQVIGINPGLKICDNYKSELLKAESLDELFKKKYQEHNEDFYYYLDRYAKVSSDDDVRKQILALYSYVVTLPEPMELLDHPMFEPQELADFAKFMIKTRAEKSLEALQTLQNYLVVHEMPKLASKLDDVIVQYGDLFKAIETGTLDEAVLKTNISFPPLRAAGVEAETKKLYETEIADLWDLSKKMVKVLEKYPDLSMEALEKEAQLLEKPVKILCTLTKEFMDIYQAKKSKNSLMDFSDGEHFTIEILKNPEVRQELQHKYKEIFVDEYQDSNPVQEAIIQAVSSGNNVFTVGDVKQSIYKFRHAEPEMFIEKYDRFKSDPSRGLVIDLNSNYRSKGPVIDLVNTVFKGLMNKDSCGIEYDDDAALKMGEPYTVDYNYDPEFYLIEAQDQGEEDENVEALKKEELEAIQAVNIINSYVDKKTINVKGKDRPISYGDIAILMKSTSSNGEVFYNTLSKAGIPVYLERSEGFFNTPEIAVFTNLLRVIDNFNQDIPLISVLHCPAFGFSTKELSDIRIFAKESGQFRFSYSQAFNYYAKNAEGELAFKCNNFLDKIKAWKLASRALSLNDFLWKLLAESGVDVFAMSLSSGAQRMANLRAMCDKALEFEQDGQGGLGGFIHLVDSLSEGKGSIKTGQAMTGGGEGCVKIMTIHKSKGLEFPMVILAGCAKGLNRNNSRESAVSFHKDFGISMEYVNPTSMLKFKPLSLKLIRFAKHREEYAENLRVLYVAITRARDIFVALGSEKNSDGLRKGILNYKILREECGSFYEMMLPYIGSVTSIYKTDVETDPRSEIKEIELKQILSRGFDVDESKLSMGKSVIEDNLFFDYSSKLPLGKKKYSVSELAKEMQGRADEKLEDESFKSPNFLAGKIKLTAAEIGTAYHKVMEHFDFKAADKSGHAIAGFIQELVNKEILREEEARAIDPANIETFFQSDLGKMVAAASEVHKESSFVLKKEYDGRIILLQGTIDCWFKYEGKLYLCDYKSNYVSPKQLEEGTEKLLKEYTPQLSLYKEALEQITGEKVEKSYLYLFSAGFNIELK